MAAHRSFDNSTGSYGGSYGAARDSLAYAYPEHSSLGFDRDARNASASERRAAGTKGLKYESSHQNGSAMHHAAKSRSAGTQAAQSREMSRSNRAAFTGADRKQSSKLRNQGANRSGNQGVNRGSNQSAHTGAAHKTKTANAQKARRQAEREIERAALPETGVRQRYFYDTSLLCAVIFVFALGCLIIYSSSQYTAALERNGNSSYYFKRQLVIGGIGLIAAVAMSFMNYRWLDKFNAIAVKFSYWGSIGLLIYTLVKGIASHGKARWINIMGIQFQPAEVAKIGLIIWIAWFISKKGRNIERRENIMAVVAHAALPFVLIIKQNISSAIIVALIAAVMLFVALENQKIFALLGVGSLALMAAIKFGIQLFIQQTGYSTRSTHYWLRRILGWAAPETFPDDAYQTLQSLYAIGSGGITGHGLGDSIQKFGKLPEAQNDMIFAIVCEEFGFIGAATLILLFMYLIFRIYQIARNANDMLGTMLCTGVMAHLGIQAVLNIAVVTGAIPNTGVTLPFISYGGSAVLFTMCEIGLVLSVAHKIPRS